jgi:hypothetical protein
VLVSVCAKTLRYYVHLPHIGLSSHFRIVNTLVILTNANRNGFIRLEAFTATKLYEIFSG